MQKAPSAIFARPVSRLSGVKDGDEPRHHFAAQSVELQGIGVFDGDSYKVTLRDWNVDASPLFLLTAVCHIYHLTMADESISSITARRTFFHYAEEIWDGILSQPAKE